MEFVSKVANPKTTGKVNNHERCHTELSLIQVCVQGQDVNRDNRTEIF